MRLQLLLLAHSANPEAPVGFGAEEVRGHVREKPIEVVDGEVHLRVGPLLTRLGHVVLLEDVVLPFAQRGDCQNQPGLIWVVLSDGVDSRRWKALHFEVVVELVD